MSLKRLRRQMGIIWFDEQTNLSGRQGEGSQAVKYSSCCREL